MRDHLYDVAIVGCGPIGAVAAIQLAQRGHSVYVCDQSTEVYARPRAIALDHEILRVFQNMGLADAVVPYTEPFTDSHFHGVDGRLIRQMTMVAPPYPQAWTPSVVFNQPPVEEVLRAALKDLPNVATSLGVAVVGLTQDDTRVILDLATGPRIEARYVIGCDGASSTLRNLVGIELEDLGFDEPWLVVDVRVNERGLARLPRHSAQYCEPDRPCSYIIGPGNHRRWEISLKEGEDPSEVVTDANTWRLLERWITPNEGELWRRAAYRFHALVAKRWRAGRVFLAGDAAHQQPPFLGQGMCQGIRDVTNLAWKLDEVLKARAGEALLESYGTERKAHVRELTTRLKAIGGLICERDADKARERDERLIADAGGTVTPTRRQDVLPRLTEGALSRHDSSARGTLFPQPWTRINGTSQRMDDWLGFGWRLFTRSAPVSRFDAACLSDLRAIALADLSEVDGVTADWFERHACTAVLVRPDHYVFGTAQDEATAQDLVAEAGVAIR